MFDRKSYSLRKSKKILFTILGWYKKKEKKLSENSKKEIRNSMQSLETALLEKNRNSASDESKKLEELSQRYLTKTFFEKTIEAIVTLLVAIFIAMLVRQMWFENMTIPSGSMRPTLKEKDFLIISKTTFSVNKPTPTGDFYFNNDLLKRGDTIVFSTADMDVRDNDYMYFFIFPGKKQFIKRLIGKPGDTLYFYGGQIYGVDREGKEIQEYQNDKWFGQIEHIPFIRFEGSPSFSQTNSYGLYDNITLMQMNTPVASLKSSSSGQVGTLLTNRKEPFSINFSAKDYYDIWGFKNYAMTRIISKKQAIEFNLLDKSSENKTDYYLELIHHPSIQKIKMERDYLGRLMPSLSYKTSIIPLDNTLLYRILDNLYTCRFNVKNGVLSRAGYGSGNLPKAFSPKVASLPDGSYEFQDGVAYKVNFFGLIKKLPPNHPIYEKSPQKIITFYNLGIEMNTLFSPSEKDQKLRPSRYAYFRDGNLYLMGHPILKKDEQELADFTSKEQRKEIPFIDNAPEFFSGKKIDKEFILKFGLRIPEDHYLMLGDNHAMSSDGRDFGFVPEQNLRGKASFVYWPPQERMGKIFQPASSWFIIPKAIVFFLICFISLGCYIYYKKKHALPIKFK